MADNNEEKPKGGIEPFKNQPVINKQDQDSDNNSTKDINIEPVGQDELNMLLSEPNGYADIVKQIRKDTISPDKTEQSQKSSDIPKYDLGKQMLASHRKNTAARRRAPGQKAPIPIESIPSPLQKQPAPLASPSYSKANPAPKVTAQKPPIADKQSETVIREIVAKDIARLCRCNHS